ncbi:LysR family transcriptional regulator [Nonomuraea dietziae]|uniref:LysR family transcriptional regulator n=1 Tax=Nonomuraea dietziae TaxID=65515 RepID=UPI0033F29971
MVVFPVIRINDALRYAPVSAAYRWKADVELRDIEIFLTLAEELHFGRTAERLRITHARVSQAIKQQERKIGADLFYRTSRTVRLTPIGEQLRDDLRPVYRELHESMRRASLAAQGKTGVLRIGMIPSFAHDLRPFWDAFRARHPQWGLQIRHNLFVEPFKPLRSGAIDVLVAWFPVEEPDLTAGPVIWTEPRALMVAAEHELVERESVCLDVLGDYGVCGPSVALPDYWENTAVPFSTPRRGAVPRNTLITTWEDMATVIADGQAIQPVHWSAIRYNARPDIAYLRIRDAPPISWGLVWRSDAETPAIRGLAQVFRDLGAFTFD